MLSRSLPKGDAKLTIHAIKRAKQSAKRRNSTPSELYSILLHTGSDACSSSSEPRYTAKENVEKEPSTGIASGSQVLLYCIFSTWSRYERIISVYSQTLSCVMLLDSEEFSTVCQKNGIWNQDSANDFALFCAFVMESICIENHDTASTCKVSNNSHGYIKARFISWKSLHNNSAQKLKQIPSWPKDFSPQTYNLFVWKLLQTTLDKSTYVQLTNERFSNENAQIFLLPRDVLVRELLSYFGNIPQMLLNEIRQKRDELFALK